jgi:hypothetical protein
MILDILNNILLFIINGLARTALYWVPVVFFYVGWQVWLHYIQIAAMAKKKWLLLEIKIPRDIFRSPAAMEIFLSNALHQTGGVGNWLKKYWDGNLHTQFSLEIISIHGSVHFYIRLEEKFQRLIEAQLYAQYPSIEITEVEDYVEKAAREMVKEPWSIWGSEITLSKDDPYPIKTYVDYGLDKPGGGLLEEDKKIDPISPMIEFLASLKAGEQVWYQILVRPSIKRFKDPKHPFKKVDWKEDAKRVKDEILAEHTVKDADGVERRDLWNMTEGERGAITAIEKSIGKPGFDVGMRSIYLAKEGAFDAINITGMLGAVKQYNSVHLNAFRPANATDFDFPWQDPTGSRVRRLKKDIFNAYWDRGFFAPPYKGKPFVLNSEELATIFHFPSRSTEAPTFERIEAKKATPPPNLPV